MCIRDSSRDAHYNHHARCPPVHRLQEQLKEGILGIHFLLDDKHAVVLINAQKHIIHTPVSYTHLDVYKRQLQARKLNQERTAGNLSAQLLYDLNGRIHGTAGSQKIIHDQHPLSFFDAVPVNMQLIASVFQIIGYAYGCLLYTSRCV